MAEATPHFSETWAGHLSSRLKRCRFQTLPLRPNTAGLELQRRPRSGSLRCVAQRDNGSVAPNLSRNNLITVVGLLSIFHCHRLVVNLNVLVSKTLKTIGMSLMGPSGCF